MTAGTAAEFANKYGILTKVIHDIWTQKSWVQDTRTHWTDWSSRDGECYFDSWWKFYYHPSRLWCLGWLFSVNVINPSQQAQLPLHQSQRLQSLQLYYPMSRTVSVTTQRGYWDPWYMTVSNGFSQDNEHGRKYKSDKQCWNWCNPSVKMLTMPPHAPSQSSSLHWRAKGVWWHLQLPKSLDSMT